MRLLLVVLVLQAMATIFADDVYEGEDISLVFQEPLQESSLYTILFNDVIIYENGSPVEGSIPAEQLSRIDIEETLSSGIINVHIKLQKADRVDAGTYTLRSNPATDSLAEENVDLVVFYPPSDPECNISNNTMYCNATHGYPGVGIISCYQGNNRLRNILQVEGSETIEAKYTSLVDDTSIGCCAESGYFVIPPGNCTQFVWYAPPQVKTTTTLHSKKNITIPTETTSISTTTEIPLETDILYLDDWLADNKATFGFVCGLLFVLVIMYPMGMVYHFKVYMKEPKKYVSDSRGRGHFTPVKGDPITTV